MTHEYGIEHRGLVELKLVLLEHSHAFPPGDLDIALVGLDLPAQYLQEGGLTRAVRTDHAIAVPFGEVEIHFLEQYPLAKGQRHVFYTDHAAD